MDIKSMNFVYYSRESYKAVPIKHIKYVWGNLDIRNYISEETIQNLNGIIISTNGGNVRVIGRDSIPLKRRYQVVSEFTESKNIKSKYVLICPTEMKWSFSELTSEGTLSDNEQYLEICNEKSDIKEMDILELASNLSYMYGIRFVPHTVTDGSIYRIQMDDTSKKSVWEDISNNLDFIQKVYKFENIAVNTNKKRRKLNEEKLKEDDFFDVKW